ncbi:MAG TPA: hypothetical protein VMB66_06975, partial [Candidatus Acidoferrales bacterium]|nr:hypothetical protein [Candidatus Acidoferrales bacterium]
MNRMKRISLTLAVMLAATAAGAQSASTSSSAGFAAFQQWMGAVLTSDATTLKGLYSTNPAAQIRIKTVMHPADADINFWLDQKVRSMQVEIVRLVVRPDRASVIFRADVVPGVPNGQPFKVTDDQYWVKQGDQWR